MRQHTQGRYAVPKQGTPKTPGKPQEAKERQRGIILQIAEVAISYQLRIAYTYHTSLKSLELQTIFF